MNRRLAIKFLESDGTGPYSKFAWPLPHDGKPGKWVKVKGRLVPCKKGIHACTLSNAKKWWLERAFLIELGGRIIEGEDKLCARRGRLVRELTGWRMPAWPSRAPYRTSCAPYRIRPPVTAEGLGLSAEEREAVS